ncbi:hypothetical protein [Rhizobium acaciae]|uniref:hypothetical protein n=1 Tax=Rhizobium acaciae TaxID=2989736 RepID=UPI00221F208F|nr:hypothetical protein [Rhizobium acaciae]MCW1751112.1 hypothetical protein [Rhizobium acaciae]
MAKASKPLAQNGKASWLRIPRSGNSLIVLTVIFGFAIILMLRLLPSPQHYVSIQALSELVRFRVTRPAVAAIAIQDATINAATENCAALNEASIKAFTGIVEPAAGAIVTYRFAPDKIAIQIESSGSQTAVLRFSEAADCPLTGAASFVLDRSGTTASRPLPIVGQTDIGVEFGAPTPPSAGSSRPLGIMWEGTIKVFGRSYFGGKLYPIADAEFPLPVGGRLSSGDDLDPSKASNGRDSVPPWYGTATVADTGFRISATTVSKDLKLYRPGTSRGEAETFGLGLLTSLFADPSVAWFPLAIAIFTVVMQTIASWMGVWRES